jgi:hypothetical protein
VVQPPLPIKTFQFPVGCSSLTGYANGYDCGNRQAKWKMHIDICEPSDTATLTAFRQALQSLGAKKEGDFDSSLGVRLVKFRIGQEMLLVFNDTWSLDIEGSEQLVQAVLNAIGEAKRSLDK